MLHDRLKIEGEKKREEFYKKQLEERQRREKRREEEKHREGKSRRWNTIIDMKYQKKINRDEDQLQGLSRQNKYKTSTEDNMLLEVIIFYFLFFISIYR